MIEIERYEKDEDGHYRQVPWKFKPTKPPKFYYILCDKIDFPLADSGSELEFPDAESARVAGLAALNKKDEGSVDICRHEEDDEGNGETETLHRYRRSIIGPSVTEEEPL